ncbi:hypothetical protein [Mycolicibacterium tusciae]|uniref:hypothetical protein n=1 Tax=Mycolicibacterium tusciae TaxID=75922 RepID=UPI00024A3672|nr:hypothetical protein [Mycolicibacterium tusciae]
MIPTINARIVAPKYASRNAGFVLAATLIARIAVIAVIGPVRSRPRITNVEKTYIIPQAAAAAGDASEVRTTNGLMFMS